MIYSSKYEVILKIMFLCPGRVGVEERSLDLIFIRGAARPFGFLVGRRAVFFSIDETRFSLTK